MTRRVLSRLGAAAIIASLWVAVLAAPAAAAGTIRYVDDNAGATGPAACDTAGFTSIQAAIDASSAWDIVRVCPGTYWETLVIDVKGLTVQSWPRRTAKIVAPAVASVEGIDGPELIVITANKVLFRGFKVTIPAGSAEPPTATVANGCSPYLAAIVSYANASRIRDNYIDASGAATYSGECGYEYGIVFAGPEVAVSSYPAGTGRARENRVRDFKTGGILVSGPEARAHVDYNFVRYLHLDDPSGPITSSLRGTTTGFAARQSGLNGALFAPFGIAAEFGAYADIQRNVVRGTFDPLIGPVGPFMISGIWMLDANDASRVRGNTVFGAWDGITLGFPGIGAGSLVSSIPAGGYEVFNNTSTDNFIGIDIASDANDVHHNRSRLNLGGIVVVDGADNTIWMNDARYNFEGDCVDETTGGGSEGTANFWTDNLGNFNYPEDLCTSTEL